MKGQHKEAERRRRINQVTETLIELKKKGMDYDEKKFIMEISLDFGVTVRKAKEYLDMAKFKNGEM